MSVQGISCWVRERIDAGKESLANLRQTIKGVDMIRNIINAFHKLGFWFLVFFMVGFICGSYATYKYQQMRMTESVMVGGFVFDNKVFDLTIRP